MTLYQFLFYILATVILASTGIAITRRNMVHAVIYLVISFFGSAMLFYLLGSPLLAALEVIVYAGAIMILFLFIVMMLKTEDSGEPMFPAGQLYPAIILILISFSVSVLLWFHAGPESSAPMELAMAEPKIFGHFLFRRHWLSIEIVSMLLLVALVGALHLGLKKKENQPEDHGDTA